MAEKVVAGSVPMATATSMRSPRRSVVRHGRHAGNAACRGVLPPAVAAITSIRAAAALPGRVGGRGHRSRSRKCSAATFWRCQCMPVVWPS